MSANAAKNWMKSNLKANNLFLYEADSVALQFSVESLDLAYKNFFNKIAKFPKFKRKDNEQSYTTKMVNNNVQILNKCIKIPKVGLVKAKLHKLPNSDWSLKRITVTKDCSDNYYVSCLFEYKSDINQVDAHEVIGLDYKSDGLYCDSEGNNCNMPKFYKKKEKKLKRLQKQLSRKKRNSNNYKKYKNKISKLHNKISNQRKDFLHKESKKIANSYDLVCIEDLDLKFISSSKSKYHLGKSTNDNGYHMFTTFLEYKLQEQGKQLIKVDKFYPSSQLCSECGERHEMPLHQRVFRCNCGCEMDRDFNAAINIKNEGLRLYRLQCS
jgi:putative transposase